jgi:hypothetical protein
MKKIFNLKKKKQAKTTIIKYFELFTYICKKYTHADVFPPQNLKTQYA